MNYFTLPNSHHPPPQQQTNNSHGEKASNSYDSMFSFFTIPVPPVSEHAQRSHKPTTQIREGEKYFVLTSDLLKLKQSDAAARLDIHPSTFSKKWRQSLPDRKWPYRKHCKIERQIKKLKEHADSMSEGQLKELIGLRDKNLEPAVIVISDSDTTTNQAKTPTPTQPAVTPAITPNTASTTTTTLQTPSPATLAPTTVTPDITPITSNSSSHPIITPTNATPIADTSATTNAIPTQPDENPSQPHNPSPAVDDVGAPTPAPTVPQSFPEH